MQMIAAPPCLSCGACCTSKSIAHAAVTGDDWSRLGDLADGLTTWIQNRVFMRMENGHCAALVATPDGVACSIYEVRPEICRTLERGSPECAGELETKTPDLHLHLPLWKAPTLTRVDTDL